MNKKELPIYGDGKQIRDWIHVEDHVSGILSSMLALIVGQIQSGEVFNFGAENEKTNLQIVQTILKNVGADESLISFVKDRPGHDRRYAMGYEKANRILGWRPEIEWSTGLSDTIQWYNDNKSWVDSITSGEYRNYIKNQYGIDN
jgi:dTDP-glucose 4,6-dehydratase